MVAAQAFNERMVAQQLTDTAMAPAPRQHSRWNCRVEGTLERKGTLSWLISIGNMQLSAVHAGHTHECPNNCLVS